MSNLGWVEPSSVSKQSYSDKFAKKLLYKYSTFSTKSENVNVIMLQLKMK